jgi:RNA polymerase-binding transcription factor DksA
MPRTSLNPSELKQYSDLLQAREKQLRATIHAGLLKSSDKSHAELAGRVLDSGEQSVADNLADLGIAQLSSAVQELSDVEAAKRRIRDATYGLCVECGAPVAGARLRAYPTAKRCIACQTRLEDMRGGRDATPSL